MQPTPNRPIALTLTLLPVAAAAALILFLVTAPGTLGLLVWNGRYLGVVVAIASAGALPAIALFVFRFLSRGRGGRGWAVLRIALYGASVLVGAALAGAMAVLIGIGGTSPVASPELNLLAREKTDSWTQPGRPLRFAFSSDAHFGGEGAHPDATADIISQIDGGGYDAFFVLGDIAEMGILDADIRLAYEAFAQAGKVPLSFVMGNHDALVAAAPRFRKTFGIASPSFRVDSGRLHIIALDLLWGAEGWSAAKAKALEAALDSIPEEDAIIVISHCFFWSSGYVDPGTGKDWFDHAETTREIAPILEKRRVDLVISGHNHYLEYLEKGDTGYLVVGALGGKPDPEPTHASPYSKWFSRDVFGFAEVAVDQGEMTINFIDRGGKILFEKRRPVNQ